MLRRKAVAGSAPFWVMCGRRLRVKDFFPFSDLVDRRTSTVEHQMAGC